MKKPLTKVIFRIHAGEVLAMFPLIPADNDGWYCESYAHVGQHCSASPGIMNNGATRRASPKEYRALAKELRRIGYRLKIITRFPRHAYESRKAVINWKTKGITS